MDQVCRGETDWPLTMLGGVGVGKTCAALCMLDAAQRGVNPIKYVTAADLVSAITATRMGLPASETPAEIWRHWKRCKLVVLDEIGARERVSDAHYEIVKQAIDYRQGKPAVFVSNLTLDRLAEVYDDRIASRLQAGTVLRMFDWQDRRL